MKEFFLYIQAQIVARMPGVFDKGGVAHSIRMWNDQFNQSNKERKEKAFRYPACFVEFIFDQADNRSLKIIDYVMTVRFHIGVVNMTYERLNTFDFIDSFCYAIQLMAPDPNAPYTFTTFQEVARGTYEESFNDVEVLTVDYRTRFRYIGAYVQPTIFGGPLQLPDPIIDIVKTLP